MQRVEAITGRCLRHLTQRKADIILHESTKYRVSCDLFLQGSSFDAKRSARDLDYCFKKGPIDRKQRGGIGDAFQAHGANFDGSAVMHRFNDGDQALIHKVEMIYPAIYAINDLTASELDIFQARSQPL